MTELFEKEGTSIFCYKTGDIIIRVKPAIITKIIYNENLGIETEVEDRRSNSIRKPVEFITVENNQIYIRDVKVDSFYKKKVVHTLHLEQYSEGWELFVIPDGLTLEDCLT